MNKTNYNPWLHADRADANRRHAAKNVIAYEARHAHAQLEKELGHLREYMTDLERQQLEEALLRLDTLHELTEGRTIPDYQKEVAS